MSPRPDPPAATDATRIGFAGLAAGPIERTLRLEAPAEQLGDLPLPFERIELEIEIRRMGERAGSKGVRARGTLKARARVECRRCLDPVQVIVTAKWDALFRSPARIAPGEEGVWALDPEAGELDLAGPVREELWVRAPRYVECAADCPGLCPTCGTRLADEGCGCPLPGPDPRWAALGGLQG
ncbi:YceD family protein [Candidatus Palauibacter sp.]|uniref:YceD family protein n=1 Tax=Candidatus Palauibacter sp. TaxID=3101350 RepID=UPI003B58E66A